MPLIQLIHNPRGWKLFKAQESLGFADIFSPSSSGEPRKLKPALPQKMAPFVCRSNPIGRVGQTDPWCSASGLVDFCTFDDQAITPAKHSRSDALRWKFQRACRSTEEPNETTGRYTPMNLQNMKLCV